MTIKHEVPADSPIIIYGDGMIEVIKKLGVEAGLNYIEVEYSDTKFGTEAFRVILLWVAGYFRLNSPSTYKQLVEVLFEDAQEIKDFDHEVQDVVCIAVELG